MEIAGYIFAVVIGLILGLIGGGGSILSVPVLVYLFGFDAITATSYSLFIVGITSLVGTLSNIKSKQINFKTALLFGIPSIFSVILVRRFLLPLIPDPIFSVEGFALSKDKFLLVLFAILMLWSSIKMISPRPINHLTMKEPNHTKVLLQGLFVGAITGLIGAGGGFLIIPALVLLLGLEMKQAIATSLFIITLNSLIGFFSATAMTSVDWQFLGKFSGLAISGILIGTQIAKTIDGRKLKPAFGVFVLLIGVYIIIKELV